jgi:GntP family gluconate:H+ symporter
VEAILFVVMLLVFAGCVMRLKWPVGLSMAAASVAMALAAGHFNPTKFLVKGMFAYLDVSLVLITAMVLMKVMELNGLLNALTRDLILKFGRSPAMFLIVLTLIVMFPGAITGSCVASVLSTGVLVMPVLRKIEMPVEAAAAIVTVASVFGMIAPPVNIVVMIIGGGMDVPYIGFDLVLLLSTVSLAIFSTLLMGYRYARRADLPAIVREFRENGPAGDWKLYIPLVVVLVLMIGPKTLPLSFPDPGLPLTFTIGTLMSMFVGKKFPVVAAVRQGVRSILPVVGILLGVGMLIEIMTLTGVRGAIVISALSLPAYLMLLGIAVSLPLFGGISVYGSASIFGVPFALALLGQDNIITIAALSVVTSIGSFLPPVALTPTVAAQIAGIRSYWQVVRPCYVPIAVTLATGLLMIVHADRLAKILL